jgi:hypothetical protein
MTVFPRADDPEQRGGVLYSTTRATVQPVRTRSVVERRQRHTLNAVDADPAQDRAKEMAAA